jgi:hypothetical protein
MFNLSSTSISCLNWSPNYSFLVFLQNKRWLKEIHQYLFHRATSKKIHHFEWVFVWVFVHIIIFGYLNICLFYFHLTTRILHEIYFDVGVWNYFASCWRNLYLSHVYLLTQMRYSENIQVKLVWLARPSSPPSPRCQARKKMHTGCYLVHAWYRRISYSQGACRAARRQAGS